MLISAEMKAALTEQIGHEFAAMLQYVTIGTYFESEGLPRLAQHFYRQAEEEREHAMRFVRYVVETGGEVTIPAMPAVKSGFGSAEEVVSCPRSKLMMTRRSPSDRDPDQRPRCAYDAGVVRHRAGGRGLEHGDVAAHGPARRRFRTPLRGELPGSGTLD